MRNKRKALGQHMLVDPDVLSETIQAAKIGGNETVCEGGTGHGIVTAELCKRAKSVISYEVDAGLYQRAREHLRYPNLHLVNADLFRTTNLHFDTFVSNLPYSRSRDAFEWLATQKFNRAIVMVQREFGAKLAAKPGTKKYRAISALATYCFRIEELFAVGRSSFEPRPMVDSVVLRVLPARSIPKEAVASLNLVFSKRNRKASTVAAKSGIADFQYGDSRIDELAVGKLFELVEMTLKNDIHAV
ncbi:MAG: ribosomal RNA small subunit methyltransferase A [Nitrososphaera sp.]